MTIKVSVIVPVYKVEKYLARCLDSLINQTLKDIEIICVNDGSPDNSAQILDDYAKKDSRIVIINQQNGGLSSARNAGMKIVKGEYTAFVDSDDWVDLDFFENLYNAAKENDCDIAVGGIIRTKTTKEYYFKVDKMNITDNINEKVLFCDIPDKSYVWNKVYNSKMLKESNITFEVGRVYEDMLFTAQIFYYSKKLVTVPNTYYYYFRHRNTIVARSNKKAEEDLQYTKEKMLQFYKEHNVNIDHIELTYRFKILGLTLYKTKTKNGKKLHYLLNFIRW